MIIVFIISGLSAGGAQRSMITVCNKLAENNLNSVYVITWLKSTDKYQIPTNVKLVNLKDTLPLGSFKLWYAKSIWDIQRTIRHIKPDFIVSVQCNMFPRVLISKFCSNAKLLVWEHTSMSRNMDFEGRIARKYLYKFADGVIVLTNKDAKLVKGLYKKVFVMPNPLPFPVCCNEHERKNIVIAIGRLDVWHIKGFDLLIQIWNKVYQTNKSWKLFIVGEGDIQSTNYLMSEISKYGVGESVTLTGYRDDIPELLQQAKIFALTSRIEGFPMSLIEAMSQGCVGVSFSIGKAIEDIINNGEDGYIVDDGDCESFSERLVNLMSDEEILKNMSKFAQNNIKRFSDLEILKRWNCLLNNFFLENEYNQTNL